MKPYEFLIPLFKRYSNILAESFDASLPTHDKCTRLHLIELCTTAIFNIEHQTMAYGKLCRWLGFIQGVMCASGLITVEGERDFTRPIFKDNEK